MTTNDLRGLKYKCKLSVVWNVKINKIKTTREHNLINTAYSLVVREKDFAIPGSFLQVLYFSLLL